VKVERIFYVTQDALVVYVRSCDGLEEYSRFVAGADGLDEFRAYLQESSQLRSVMLVDVIEEEFSVDSIPKLGWRDRKALIERRLQRKFPRSPFRLSHYQGGRNSEDNAQNVMYSAITNPELLDPWLQEIAAQRTPLSGIQSVPMMAAALLSRMRKADGNALLMTLHQGDMLRQVFVQNGKAKSARLAKSPNVSDPAFGEFIFSEVLRSRRFLERNRLLSALEDIDIYVVADKQTADLVLASDRGTTPMRIHFIDPAEAASMVGQNEAPDCDHIESLYLSLLLRGNRKSCYASRAETRFGTLQVIRHSIVGAALAASVVCAAMAGTNIVDGLFLQSAAAATEKQILQITETLQRENENFAPVRASSVEMKLAVDTGDYILQNRLPVAWVLGQISAGLSGFPQVSIDELSWVALPPDGGQPAGKRLRPGEKPPPVVIPALTYISVDVAAQIQPFSGDMRDAFAIIDQLVASLQTKSDFSQVVVTEYPLDASPASSVAGEIVRGGIDRNAHFRLRLSLATAAGESDDEVG